MERIWQKLKRIRLVYRRSTPLMKTAVVSAIVLSVAALLVLQLTITATENRTKELAEQAARLEQENQDLNEKIDALGSADSVEQIAKDELGLSDPEDVIIEPEE